MYLSEETKNALIQSISEAGAHAVCMLEKCSDEECSHPDSYAAGYLQGYVHGADAACAIVEGYDA